LSKNILIKAGIIGKKDNNRVDNNSFSHTIAIKAKKCFKADGLYQV
jgi:hypothetical protein